METKLLDSTILASSPTYQSFFVSSDAGRNAHTAGKPVSGRSNPPGIRWGLRTRCNDFLPARSSKQPPRPGTLVSSRQVELVCFSIFREGER